MSYRPDHLVRKRQQFENTLADRQSAAAAAAKEERKVEWELRNEQRAKAAQIKSKYSALVAADERKLELRRQKLARLIEREEAVYAEEIRATIETPESKVEAMRRRTAELKAAREAERQAFVQEQLDRKWRSEADGLRHMESQALIKKVAADREASAQIVAAAQQKKALEEAEFAAAWEASRQDKLAREEADKLRAKALINDQYEILNQQMGLVRERRLREQQVKDEQQERLQALWAADAEAREREKAEKAALIEARVKELDHFNHLSIARKAREKEEEENLNREIVSRLVAAERNEEAEARARVEQAKQATKEYRSHLERQRHRDKEDSTLLDRLCAEEQDREWQKRESRWAAEAAAREKLMEEVYTVREQQVGLRIQAQRAEAEAALRDRERLANDIAATKALEQQEKDAKKAAQDAQKRALLAQMDKKRTKQEQEEFEAMLEHKERLREQEEYDRRLQAELKRDVVLVNHPKRRATFQYS